MHIAGEQAGLLTEWSRLDAFRDECVSRFSRLVPGLEKIVMPCKALVRSPRRLTPLRRNAWPIFSIWTGAHSAAALVDGVLRGVGPRVVPTIGFHVEGVSRRVAWKLGPRASIPPANQFLDVSIGGRRSGTPGPFSAPPRPPVALCLLPLLACPMHCTYRAPAGLRVHACWRRSAWNISRGPSIRRKGLMLQPPWGPGVASLGLMTT
jgi:hypothetical protein